MKPVCPFQQISRNKVKIKCADHVDLERKCWGTGLSAYSHSPASLTRSAENLNQEVFSEGFCLALLVIGPAETQKTLPYGNYLIRKLI